MKTLKRAIVLIAIIFAYSSYAKTPSMKFLDPKSRVPAQMKNLSDMPSFGTHVDTKTFPTDPLSALVAAQGANFIGVRSHYYLQTNGRGLHNIQVDPDAPNQVHAIIMATSSNADNDSMGGDFNSRRVYYTYSSDGGKEWNTPKIVGNTRLGYPQLLLYKRDGVNIPIIVAHQGPAPESEEFVIHMYIEQGAPGAGNFALTTADRMATDGSEYNFIFPTVALSNDQKTLHIVAAPTFSVANTYGYLEYGNFTLNDDRTATWKGWKNRPGGQTNDGFAAGGIIVLRVAPNGTIGVIWLQPEEDNKKLFFVESSDNGETWTQNYKPFYVPDGPNASLNDALLSCNDGLDFFYDADNIAHFIWEADYQVFADNTFYPYSSLLFSWAMGDTKVNILTSSFIPEFTDLAIFDTLYLPIEQQHPFDFFTPDAHSTAGGYTPTGIPLFSNPTIAINSMKPNNWKVYYTTYVDGDEQSVGDFDGTGEKFYYFRSIFEQTTNDNGQTWSEPKHYRSNNGVAEEEKLDYAFPQASFFNAPSGDGANFATLFAADSMPGQLFNYGTPGWSYVSWYEQTQSTNAVKSPVTYGSSVSLGQNYPNPSVSGTTTVPFELVKGGEVVLTVTDLIGREMLTIAKGRMESGKHSFQMDISSLTSGVYQYTLRSSGEAVSRLMTIVKD